MSRKHIRKSPHGRLLRALLPPQSYDPNADNVSLSVEADGLTLDRAYADALTLTNALNPFTFAQWLPDYERVYGLPDPCTPADAPLETRIRQLAVALQERRGISRRYYYWLAAVLGYEISIEEYLPFVAGSNAGNSLYNGNWRYVWVIRAQASGVQHFSAGRAVAGEPLRAWGDDLFECVFQRLAPAHTRLYFAYGEASGWGACLACTI